MSPLPNVAALLAEATTGKWRSRPCNDLPPKGRYRWVALGSNGNDTSPLEAADARLIAAAPALAAALIEAADALAEILGHNDELKPIWQLGAGQSFENWVGAKNRARAALARLVAFDASLKETTE